MVMFFFFLFHDPAFFNMFHTAHSEADPDGGAGGVRPHLAKKKKVVDLLLCACA